MAVPLFIKQDSKIRIVSPAGKIKETLVLPAAEWLEKQGCKIEMGKHIFAQHCQFAGTDEQRLEDLQTALDDPECSAIICSRGGYGTVRVIDQLDFTEFKKHPKWVVGYSDVTMLHNHLNNMGFASVHGAMPPFFFNEKGESNENLDSLKNLLCGQKVSYTISANEKNKNGNTNGQLVGGNLSIITSLFGTRYELDTENKILFIEEIDEYLYHIDRMMHQLKLAGKLDKLAGIVVGDFTNIKDNDSPFGKTIEEIILDAVKEFNFPVCFGFPGGHDKKNLALSFGNSWELNVSKKSSILKLI
ncbi:MAG: LD-carboxypeptidase [Bacteroidetes bacterium]|nr:LD-carboxypeptidase [Bacteroidota bacterium]